VIEFPTIRSRIAPGAATVPSAVRDLTPGAAIVFTGAAAVKGFVRALASAEMDVRALAGFTLVGVGRETIAALRRHGLRCDLALRSYLPIRVAAELHRAMGSLAAHPVLLVRDGQAASALGEGLEAAGASVTQIEVATRAVDERGRQSLERLILRKRLDAVVLASSSAAEALIAAGLKVPPATRVFAIGPSAAATAQRLGLPQARVPDDSGADALVADVAATLREVAPDADGDSSLAASSD
jgi:uroporphyrinogen-III synthase